MSRISKAAFERLPAYLNYLRSLPADSGAYVSATSIAAALNLGDVQVRKDLAAVSGSGKPKVGYVLTTLISELEDYLGYHDVDDAVIVGAGKLGIALLEYRGFDNYGLNILAAFDGDRSVTGTTPGGKPILHMSQFDAFVKKTGVKMGILTVPAECAQEVCDRMIRDGILAILNFAPVHLETPDGILVQNENMATALAALSTHLKERMKQSTE